MLFWENLLGSIRPFSGSDSILSAKCNQSYRKCILHVIYIMLIKEMTKRHKILRQTKSPSKTQLDKKSPREKPYPGYQDQNTRDCHPTCWAETGHAHHHQGGDGWTSLAGAGSGRTWWTSAPSRTQKSPVSLQCCPLFPKHNLQLTSAGLEATTQLT